MNVDPSTSSAHTFANGIKVSSSRLLPAQIARYKSIDSRNLHEPEEEEWFHYVFDNTEIHGFFLDVGAAIGYYSVLVSIAKPEWKILAMEPLKEMREAIFETFKLNERNPDNLKVDKRALSDLNGTAKFYEKKYGSGLAPDRSKPSQPFPGLLHSMQRILFGAQAQRSRTSYVETVSLGKILEEIQSRITLMKIDIQGHEVKLIDAVTPLLSNGLVEWIIVGTHGERRHIECLNLLSKAFQIVHEDQSPAGQPDGLIVARFPT